GGGGPPPAGAGPGRAIAGGGAPPPRGGAPYTGEPTRRNVIGTLAALSCIAVLTAVMLPLRAHLSTATTALVLAIPVVVGVASGGYLAGGISDIAGFVGYASLFGPPSRTLAVGPSGHTVAIG